MERYVTETLGGAYADMRRRYRFTPNGPVHIEMFSNTQHFSVRTTGLPNVGVQGVCFGQLITALSPRAGPFNWAQIVWHELAHVFHIQLSNNRVPRWFTEGLAEYETIIARPEWQREEDHRLYRALESGRLPPLRELNHAFTHARNAEEMTVAYYASSMLVKYIVERFGFAHVPRMLREWGQGRTTEEVIQRVLSVDIDALDRDFREHTRTRLAALADDYDVDFSAHRDLDAARAHAQQHQGDADAHAALAASLYANREAEEAMEEVRRALRLNRGQPLARFVGARLQLAQRRPLNALTDLRLLIESGHDGYAVRMLQARVALRQRDGRLAREALEAAVRIDAGRLEAWQGLLQIAERSDNSALRARALVRVVDLDQHDRGSNYALMQALAAQEQWDTLLEYGQRSVFVDPLRSESRRLYAEALVHAERGREALAEADAALALEPEEPGSAHLTRARALMLLRRRGEAREAASLAVEADASLAARARPILSP